MVYVHWLGAVLLAITLFKFGDVTRKKSVVFGLIIALVAVVCLLVLGIYLERGTLMEIASMRVPHRSSAYLMGLYGIILAAAAFLVCPSSKVDKRKAGTRDTL